MRILFVMHNQGFVPYYESALRLLAQRGHTVHLAFNQPFRPGEYPMAEQLAAAVPNVTYSLAPARGDAWSALATAVRGAMDYVRYLHPIYRDAHKLRERALVWPSHLLLWVAHMPFLRTPACLRFLIRCLQLVEQAIPNSRTVAAFISSTRPDLLLITPLVETASKQVDYVKSAGALGIRTGLCVASWDNLTNKGLIRVEPDAVFVWNEYQKREAVELHDVAPEKVVVTGAQLFDESFERRPSTSREAFCARLGLSAERPILLYVCSSPLIAEQEVPFVKRWIRSIRAAAAAELRRASIVVRPHPQNAEQWQTEDLSEFEAVTIWPRGAINRLDPAAKSDFFDSLHHSTAVVGINTSALIEAGIVGRPVYTLLAPEFRGTQDALPQFAHLREVGGGLLQVAERDEQHLEQLAGALNGGSSAADRAHRFVEAFIRPHGRDRPCTPILVDAIERLASARVAAQSTPPWGYLLRVPLFPLALAMNRAWLAVKDKRVAAAG